MRKSRRPPMPDYFYHPKPGTCRFCNSLIFNKDGTASNRKTWHRECVQLYLVMSRPQVARKEIEKRDKGRCRKCGKKCRKDEWQADHVLPLHTANGDLGFWQLDNLQTLCVQCHAIKTKEENVKRTEARNRL